MKLVENAGINRTCTCGPLLTRDEASGACEERRCDCDEALATRCAKDIGGSAAEQRAEHTVSAQRESTVLRHSTPAVMRVRSAQWKRLDCSTGLLCAAARAREEWRKQRARTPRPPRSLVVTTRRYDSAPLAAHCARWPHSAGKAPRPQQTPIGDEAARRSFGAALTNTQQAANRMQQHNRDERDDSTVGRDEEATSTHPALLTVLTHRLTTARLRAHLSAPLCHTTELHSPLSPRTSSIMSSAAPAAAGSDDASLLSLASEYVRWEENAAYRSTVASWIASQNLVEIRAHFLPRIAFGTAGLRARMAPGYKHMNALVITQTSQGFVRYLEQQYAASLQEAKERGLILGYDGRHNSRRYAEIVAAIFLAAGFRVHLFSRMVGTPLVPFGLLHLKAIAGVVITASHNPKEDNGFKVYWTNGAQIIPPHDAGIAAAIRENLKPWHAPAQQAEGAEVAPLAFDASHPRLSDPFDEVTGAYFKRSGEEYCWRREQNAALTQQSCPVTFTAMHGVGAPFTARAFAAFSLPPYIPTPAQIEADPEFPTVRFPNPEEGKGALKLAMETADASGSRLILANDPDADRLAVAEKVGEEWVPLNGNQIALLLASWTFENYVSREKPTKEQLSKTCMTASTVSSAVLASMAQKEGFNFYPTLTGFKCQRAHTLATRTDSLSLSCSLRLSACAHSTFRLSLCVSLVCVAQGWAIVRAKPCRKVSVSCSPSKWRSVSWLAT